MKIRNTLILTTMLLTSCVASQPRNVANVCDMFEDRRSWYRAAERSEDRWGVPVPVAMAFIHQESTFQGRAKPERTRFLWIFPGPRPSTAYGYAQALETTWNDYISATGNRGARRNNFGDAIDFIGWYNAMSIRTNRIDPNDAANLYLAYHEGNAGYARRTYSDKPWLIETAYQVQANADRFRSQYGNCKRELERNWFFRLFS
ncbi:MAG: hypothetical protein WD772_06345 [Pseudohongiellaceae bacterium]